MDFGPARAFDEQDLVNAIATESSDQKPEKNEAKTWIKRIQYMVLG
jgi:amino acid transporter